MRRRALLARVGAVVGAVATVGCTTDDLEDAERPPPPLGDLDVESVDLPVTQPLGVAAAAIERAAGADVDAPDALAASIEDGDLTVDTLTVAGNGGEPALVLGYRVPDAVDRGLMSHLGHVAGGYAALVAAGHGSERLDATVHDRSGEAFGTYEIRRPWVESYLDGAITARAYAGEIGVTVEAV